MKNELYPVFLRLDRLNTVVVGGGLVAMEKLHFILKSSPQAQLTVWAPEIRPEIQDAAKSSPNIKLVWQEFAPDALVNQHIVVAATNIKELNIEIHRSAKALGLVVNVADTPDLCDFYMGSIVTRGNLKVGISTNGTSPTFAKRFRQLLEDILPEEVDDLLLHLKQVRDNLELDFEQKVEYLNDLTKSLVEERP